MNSGCGAKFISPSDVMYANNRHKYHGKCGIMTGPELRALPSLANHSNCLPQIILFQTFLEHLEDELNVSHKEEKNRRRERNRSIQVVKTDM